MVRIREKIILITILLLLILMISIWIYEIKIGKMPYVDQWTRSYVDTVAGTFVYVLFRWITELGSKSFVLPFAIAMVPTLGLLYRNWLQAFTFGIGVLGSHLLNKGIKIIVARERPTISALLDAEGYSFPSGHAMVSIVCYGILAYYLMKKVKSKSVAFVIQMAFALLIFSIGISRYLINVHFLTDIITGFVIGFIYLLAIIYVYEKILHKQNQS